jgi:protein gp37
MSEQTKIEWCDSTFNPWMGCTKVSPACDHCYAERDTKRFGRVQWGAGQPRVRTNAENWRKPVKWNDTQFFACKACGWRGDINALLKVENALSTLTTGNKRRGAMTVFCKSCPSCHHGTAFPSRRRVFCASLADWLDNEVPIEWLVDLLDLIRRTPNLDWLALTKRIGNFENRLRSAQRYIANTDGLLLTVDRDVNWLWLDRWLNNVEIPSHVWIGSTVVNQDEADRDIPKLLRVPARIRFLSIEPMLGAVTINDDRFTRVCSGRYLPAMRDTRLQGIDWIICGGESGPHARPMHPDWVRSLRDQCAAAGVPFLLKQWGEWQVASTENGHHDCDMSRNNAVWVDVYGTTAKPSSIGLSDPYAMVKVGKKAAGRVIDGRTHDGYPA